MIKYNIETILSLLYITNNIKADPFRSNTPQKNGEKPKM